MGNYRVYKCVVLFLLVVTETSLLKLAFVATCAAEVRIQKLEKSPTVKEQVQEDGLKEQPSTWKKWRKVLKWQKELKKLETICRRWQKWSNWPKGEVILLKQWVV